MENLGALNAWTKKETLHLIEEYKKHPVLYHPHHPESMIPQKRKEAFLAIVQALKFLKPTVSESQIKTKLKTLRHQLASEKKKLIRAEKNGNAAHFKPALWCYDELTFLVNINNEQAAQISDDSQIYEPRTNEEPEDHFIKPQQLRHEIDNLDKFQKTINKSMEIMEQISSNKNPKSKEEAFCHYLSTELTALRLEESFDEFKMSAMVLLQNVKAKERKFLTENTRHAPGTCWRNASYSDADAASSVPSRTMISFQNYPSSASSSEYSRSVQRSRRNIRRKRSSSVESVLVETIQSSNNDFEECDVKIEPDDDF